MPITQGKEGKLLDDAWRVLKATPGRGQVGCSPKEEKITKLSPSGDLVA